MEHVPPHRNSSNSNNRNLNPQRPLLPGQPDNVPLLSASPVTTVRFCGASQSECGYCHGERASIVQRPPDESSVVAMGLWMEGPSSSSSTTTTTTTSSRQPQQQHQQQLTALYEQFVYRGWRRSGRYLYKPDNWSSCCPAITIRLDVNLFTPSKSQRRVINKMNHLLQPLPPPPSSTISPSTTADASSIITPSPSSQSSSERRRGHPQATAISRKSSGHLETTAKVLVWLHSKSRLITLLQQWTGDILRIYWMEHQNSTGDQAPSLPTWWDEIMPPTFKLLPQTSKTTTTTKSAKTKTTKPFVGHPAPSPSDDHGHHKKKQRPIAVMSESSPTAVVAVADTSHDELNKQQRPQQQVVWTLSTSICAAIAGRSQRGKKQQQPAVKATLCRDDVSNYVAEALQRQWNQWIASNQHLDQQQQHPAVQTIQIHSIESHAKSGHILVHLALLEGIDITTATELDNNKSFDRRDGSSGNLDDQVMQDCEHPITATTTTDGDDDKRDLFATWRQKETTLRRGNWAWSQRQLQEQRQQQQQAPQPTRQAAAYQLQVTTMSAWDSALDPDVFRLYTLYQHQVHQDKDALAFEYSNSTNDSSDVEVEDNAAEPNNDDVIGDENWNREARAMLETAFFRNDLTRDVRRRARILHAFDAFVQFLVDTPFPDSNPQNGHHHRNNNNNDNKSFLGPTGNHNNHVLFQPGTYHQHYRIDGALVAVGVVDLLPQGLSSVYLFYHPSFSHTCVALGKYCSLKEIEFARQDCHVPYYYLGYYIESCPKMRYKAEYQPSELLCPVTYQWVNAELAQSILRTRSPIHHCCALYYPPVQDDHESMVLLGNNQNQPSNAAAIGNSNTNTNTNTNRRETDNILNSIRLEVGLPQTVTLGMLQEPYTTIIRPLLESLYKETSAQIVRQCIVNLN